MTIDEARSVLHTHGQEQVLAFWDKLDAAAQADLLAQVAMLNFSDVEKLQGVLAKRTAAADASLGDLAPAPVKEKMTDAERADYRACGEALLRAGKVGCLVVAGGQGSRLGFEGPKGCYPIAPISNRPLFWFHARKIVALRRLYGASVPFYVMTSVTNDAATRQAFADADYFGLPKEDVFFFTQAMWPALTPEGKIILDAPGHIFFGPDGHGGMLAALERSGALADMKRRGLTTIAYFQVDNPMTDLADPVFLGFHEKEGSEYSLKLTAKTGPAEGMGNVVVRNGKTQMVEYTEFTDEYRNQRTPDGELRFKYGSVAIHIFSVDFLAREAKAGLPIHIAHKKVPYVDAAGALVKPTEPNAYKFEKFIFDSMLDATKLASLAFCRAEEFSPVKNAEGTNSPATCREALQKKFARWLNACGVKVPVDAEGHPAVHIEIDPAFANGPAMLADALKGVTVDTTKDILLEAK